MDRKAVVTSMTGTFSMSTITIKSAFEKFKSENYVSETFAKFSENRIIIAERLAKQRPGYSASDVDADGFPNGFGNVITPDRIACHIECFLIGTAENIAAGIAARLDGSVNRVYLDNLRLTESYAIFQYPDVFHTGKLKIIGILAVDGIDRLFLIQTLAGFPVRCKADMIQMHMCA